MPNGVPWPFLCSCVFSSAFTHLVLPAFLAFAFSFHGLHTMFLMRCMFPGFRRSFLEADKRGLVFVNPRPNYGRADTLESALEEKQFRVKNMVRPVRRLLLNGERRLRENEAVEPGYGREGGGHYRS